MINYWNDIKGMHAKFGVSIEKYDDSTLREFLKFRISQLREELNETEDAYVVNDPEEIVDGIIDLMVFAIGTLDLYGVNIDTAWKKVLDANMSKEVGVKEGRANPFGLPDLRKPEGWVAPNHAGNHGLLTRIKPSEDKELDDFISSVGAVADGIDNVEDFKFCTAEGIPISSSEFLQHATGMLTNSPQELRDC